MAKIVLVGNKKSVLKKLDDNKAMSLLEFIAIC